jgi:protein-S-isoprenylcysteine O-methyltransferase Ste14
MSWLEHRVPPPIVLGVFAAGAVFAARLWPDAAVLVPGRTLAAVLLAAAGLAVIAAGIVVFRRARTTVNPLRPDEASALVDSGVFARTRNPMYLGMALGLAALAVWLGHAAGPVMLAGFVGYITRFQIVPEERALRANFGAAFDAYAARVRRWI